MREAARNGDGEARTKTKRPGSNSGHFGFKDSVVDGLLEGVNHSWPWFSHLIGVGVVAKVCRDACLLAGYHQSPTAKVSEP
jgi:hypothetical protein